MTSRWTRTIGVVVGDIQLPFFATIVRAMDDAAQAAGWEVILANTNEDIARERAVVRVLHEERVDGLIIASASSEDDDHLTELVDLGTPVFLLDRRTMHLEVDALVTDNRAAMRRAVELLVRLGHWRVGIVGNTGWTPLPIPAHMECLSRGERDRVRALAERKPAVARYQGYVDGMQAAGLPIDDRLIRHADYSRESVTVQALSLLDQADRATAIVTTDSLMTMGVLAAVRQAGLRMPVVRESTGPPTDASGSRMRAIRAGSVAGGWWKTAEGFVQRYEAKGRGAVWRTRWMTDAGWVPEVNQPALSFGCGDLPELCQRSPVPAQVFATSVRIRDHAHRYPRRRRPSRAPQGCRS